MSHPLCSYCGIHVSFPCETRCEEKECNALRAKAQEEAQEALDSKDTSVHPTHYSRWPMEPIEFIAKNDLPWWLANVIKYTMRYDAKDGLKDLYKAREYLGMKITLLEDSQNADGSPSGIDVC